MIIKSNNSSGAASAALAAWQDALKASLASALAGAADSLKDSTRQQLVGGALTSRSGRLKESITQTLADESFSLTSDVPYAAILEYGGQTGAHIIRALRGKALAFSRGGEQGMYASVHHPGSRIPAFGYFSAALEQDGQMLMEQVTQAVLQPLGEWYE